MFKTIFKWAFLSMLFLVIIAAAYFIVMSARYYGFSDTPAVHIPESVDIFIQADSPQAIKDSAIYKLFKEVLKDKILRANFENAFGADFVKSADDDTLFKQAISFIKKEVVCGIKLTGRNYEGVLATQMPLRYFIFTPLVNVALQYAGFTKNTEDGITYFSIHKGNATIFTTVENRNVLVSTGKGLLLEAARSITDKSGLASGKKGITAILTGDSLKYVKDIASQFPFSELFRDIDIGTLTKFTIKSPYDSAEIPIELTLQVKGKAKKLAGTLPNFQQFIPPQPLMVYIEKSPAIKNWERVKNNILAGEQSKEDLPKYLYNTFGVMVKDLVKKGIEENLLSLCGDSTSFIFDSEEFEFREPTGIWSGDFPVLGFVAPLQQNGKAVDILDDITSATLRENPGAGEMVTIEYKGQDIRVFRLGVKAVEILKVFDPCYAEVNGCLLFATSEKLILKMVESTFRKAQFDASAAQNSDIFLYINMNNLRNALDGPIHIGATAKVDTDGNKRAIRSRLEMTHPHQSDKDIERIDKLVIQEVENQKYKEELKQKETFRWLLYITNVNLNLATATDGLDINITLQPILK